MGRHFASLLQQETDLLNLILVGLPTSDNVPKLVGHETRQKMTVKETMARQKARKSRGIGFRVLPITGDGYVLSEPCA
jgi:hypothetical protein